MNCKEKKMILDIYNDCLKLKKQGELTSYGEGQMDLCKILLK